MKVFLSWSGDLSHKIAIELREWLPFVIQSIEPYVSSEDIDKGTRWSIDIAKELEDSSFGILCVTPQNLNAPWLNFEAGALSKAFDNSYVSPFLFGLKPSDLKKSPLLQFQHTLYDKKDFFKLICSINKALGDNKLKEDKLKTTFDNWYNQLKEKLDALLLETGVIKEESTVDQSEQVNQEILEELLELSRSQQKMIRNPEMLFPPDYLREIFSSLSFIDPNHQVWHDLEIFYTKLRDQVEQIVNEAPNSEPNKDLRETTQRLGSAISYITRDKIRNPMRRTKWQK